MRYRPEIDGLRAIAVVPVILFHAMPDIMPGGFIGVDIFFVISGYLITRILLDDFSAGRFSIVGFYERRMRRIAPALLFVCLACLPFAAMWMLAEEVEAFGKALFHTLLMVSNFELWGDTDYFAASSELKPLLHTWSLSVEEQFYLVFPVLLWAMRRCERQTIFWIVAALSVVSFALIWPISAADPVANFYLPFTRFWELSAGALLAIGGIRSFDLSPRSMSALAMAGLVGILLGCALLDAEGNTYPGPLTLIPVVCTTLILAYASPANLAGRLLAMPVFVAIGLISYSLYLWHQPIFAFARIRSLGHLPEWSYALLIGLTFVMATVSYFFVERPFRRSKRIGRRQVFGYGGGGAVALIVLGIFVAEADGFPGRYPEIAGVRQAAIGLRKTCIGEVRPAGCASSDKPVVAVWGDSYAMHLVDGILSSELGNSGGILQLTMSSCAPMATLARQREDRSPLWSVECLKHNQDARKAISDVSSLRYVVLASPYLAYLQAESLIGVDGNVRAGGYELVLAEFEATADWVRSVGLKPVFIAPPPRNGRDVAACAARAKMFGLSNQICAMERHEQREYDAPVTRLMADLSRRFPVVSIEDFLCDEFFCRLTDENVSIYRDSGHYSRNGSIQLGKKLGFYQAFINAAENGCGGRAGVPSGICQLMPVDRPTPVGAQARATSAKDPG